MAKVVKYQRIVDPSKHTPAELLWDLRIRAGHYAREAKYLAQKNIRMDKHLTVFSFLISIFITTCLFLFQSGIIDNKNIVWVTIFASAAISGISIFQRFSFDGMVSAKTLRVSQHFYEIKEEIKLLQVMRQVDKMTDKEVMDKYEDIIKRYHEKREKFIEHVHVNHQYYGFTRGPGRIKESEPLDVVTINDEELVS